MKETVDQKLIESAKQIMDKNPEGLLSGSLALSLQGINIRRAPKDIDIYIPFGKVFQTPEGMRSRTTDGDNDEYNDEYYERSGYSFNGLDVDVFTPINTDVPEFISSSSKGFDVVIDFEIIKMKVSHSLGEHWTRFKHKQDIIHMMVNNAN